MQAKQDERRGRNRLARRGQLAARSGHENEGQEARAEQDQTGCGQGQETVGDRIMMAHVTSSFFRSSPELIKTFRTSQLKQVMRRARSMCPQMPIKVPTRYPALSRDQARDRTPSKACAMKMPAPTRPIIAVTISNIANILCPAREQNDAQARTVKRISWMVHTMGWRCGFYATYVPNPSRLQVRPWRVRNVSFTNARPSPFLPWSPCGIFTTRCGGGDRIVACGPDLPR